MPILIDTIEPRVIVVGHAALDSVYRVAEFPTAPTKIRALEHVVSGGGMAANAAACIARLGGTVELWSRVGDDTAGEQILAHLARDGVVTRAVRVCHGARSSTSAILVDRRGERIIIGERDHAMPVAADWLPLGHVAAAGAVLSDLRWFEGTRAAFVAARAHAVPTVLDVDLGGAGHVAEFLNLADYPIFSAPALAAFAPGLPIEQQLQTVLQHGPKLAAVTRGAAGCAWMDASGEMRYQPAFAVDAVDTTGAGDAFHGAFTWALARREAIASAFRLAAAVSALKCLRLGARAGLPTAEETRAFLTTL